MRTVGEKEGVDPHIYTSLMHEIQIADSGCSNCNSTTCAQSVEDSGYEDSIPSCAMTCYDICNSRNQVPQQVDWSTAVDIRKGSEEERTDAREYDIYCEFV